MAYQITVFNLAQVVNAICGLVGYSRTADPAGSTDPKHVQMVEAVNAADVELMALNEWQDITIKATMSIVADSLGQKEKAFDMPEDFFRFVDQTQWGAQSRLPAMGPISNQAWMQYIVRNYVPQLTLFWQFREDKLHVLNPPYPTPVNFDFMYVSKGLVRDEIDPTLLKNIASKNGDTFVLDSYLILLLARKKWLEWNSFDSSAATIEYNDAFNSRVAAGKGGAVLSLNSKIGLPLISPLANLPDSSYGIT